MNFLRMRKTSRTLCLCFLLLAQCLCLTPRLHAGWIISERFTSGHEVISTQKVFFQDYWVRIENRDQIQIFDLRSGTLIFLFPGTKTFWQGSLHEYQREAVAAIKQETEDHIASLPEEKRLEYRQLVMGYLTQLDNVLSGESRPEKTDIRLMKNKRQENVAGTVTWKYDLYAGRQLVRQIWIPVKPVITGDLAAYARLSSALTFDSPPPDIEGSPEYMSVVSAAYPLKIKYSEGKDGLIRQVESVRQAELPASGFRIPEGYKAVTIGEIRLGKAFPDTRK